MSYSEQTMRTLKVFLLATSLFAASVVSADAVVGKNRFLIGGRQNAFWVPLGGGAVEMVIPGQATGLSLKNRSFTSVATDGDRFLVAYCGAGVGLYEEGDTYAPQSVTPLEGVASRCFAQWDGSRYLVAWNVEGGVQIAALTRDGAILQSAAVTGFNRVAGLAVNGDRILVLDARGYVGSIFIEPPDEIGVRALVLDSQFTPVKESTIGRLKQINPHQEVLSAAPFGTGFYVAWYQGVVDYGGQWNPDSQVLGTRINAEGTALDVATRVDPYGEPMLGGRVLQRNANTVIDVELVTEGNHVVALMEHHNGDNAAPVNGVFVGSDGLNLGSRPITQVTTELDGVFTRLDVVRLADGKVVAVSIVNGTATIIPVVTTPPVLPRRRAVR